MVRLLGRCMVLAVVLCVVCAGRVGACTFPPPLEPQEGYSLSNAVLRGRVIQVVYSAGEPRYRLGAILEVGQVWKGAPTEQVYVRAIWSPMLSCPDRAPFREGAEFIVYAERTSEGLNIGFMHEAVPIDAADKHLDYLATIASSRQDAYAVSLGKRLVEAEDRPNGIVRSWPMLVIALLLLFAVVKLSPIVSGRLRQFIVVRRG
jgi:hypothetical protein